MERKACFVSLCFTQSYRKDGKMRFDLTRGDTIFDQPGIQTKMDILHAVDEPLDRTTITKICKNAGISRKTFYRHFESKYDIPWWHTIYCRKFYLNEIGRTIDWRTGYYHYLRMILMERDFYRLTIKGISGNPFAVTPVSENRVKVLLDTLERYRNVTIDDNMKFLVETFSRLECAVIDGWLKSSQPADLHLWTDYMISLVPPRLYEALKLENELPPPPRKSRIPERTESAFAPERTVSEPSKSALFAWFVRNKKKSARPLDGRALSSLQSVHFAS